MSAPADPAVPAARMSPGKGLLVLLAIIVGTAALLGLFHVTGVTAPYAGFLFLLYWAGLNHAAPELYLPSLIGGLVGIALAWGLTVLPLALGTGPGFAVALGLLLLAIYMLVMGWLPIAINNSTMLFLTVASAAPLHNVATLAQMARGLVVGAAFAGALFFILKRLTARQGAQTAAGV